MLSVYRADPCGRAVWGLGLRGHSLAGITRLDPAEGMDVCLLWMLCVVR
jgi:hypothetical protein